MKTYKAKIIIENGLISEIYRNEINDFVNQVSRHFLCTDVVNFNTTQLYNEMPEIEYPTIIFVITCGYDNFWNTELSNKFLQNLINTNKEGYVCLVQPLYKIDFLARHTEISSNSDIIMNLIDDKVSNSLVREYIVDDFCGEDMKSSYLNEYINLPFIYNEPEQIELLIDVLTNGGKISLATLPIKKTNENIIEHTRLLTAQQQYNNYAILGYSSFASYFINRENFSVKEVLSIHKEMYPNNINVDKRSVTSLFYGGIVEKIKGIDNMPEKLYKLKDGIKEILIREHGLDNAERADKILSILELRKKLNQDLYNDKKNKTSKKL